MRLRYLILLASACNVPVKTYDKPRDAGADAPADAPPAAMISISQPTGDLALGDVIVGQTSAPTVVTVSNDGGQDSGMLQVSLDDAALGITIGSDTCSQHSLQPHHTCSFRVTFAPTESGDVATMLHVAASPGGEATAMISATGLIQGQVNIVEQGHEFSGLNIDAAPLTTTFTIENTGQTTIGMPVPSFTGTSNSYSITQSTCTGPTLAPARTCMLTVSFDPSTVGSKGDSLRVDSDMGGGADAASLGGTGTAHVHVTRAGTGAGTVTSQSVNGILCGSTCDYDFSSSPVTFESTAAPGSTFSGWSACSGTDTCSLTLDGSKTLTATFAIQYYNLTVTQNGAGGTIATAVNPSNAPTMSCGASCTAYPYQTSVTLTPTASAGWTFTGWSGDCTGTGPCMVTMDDVRNVTATFTIKHYLLGVTRNGTGSGRVTSDKAGANGGIDCSASSNACSDDYDHGTSVVLTAVADTGSNFTGWSGCDAVVTNKCTVSMIAAKSATATFTQGSYAIAISPAPTHGTVTSADGNFNCGSACTHSYAYQASVQLTANPATGYHFDHWSGGPCDTSTVAECDLQVPAVATTTMTPIFAINSYTLTLTVNGTGAGSVSSTPMGISSCVGTCTADYNYQQTVQLTAMPASGSTLTWSGCDTVNGNLCNVTILGATAVTATFSAGPQTLTVTMAGNATGRVQSQPAGIDCPGTCQASFAFGTSVQLTTTATAPVQFAGWTGDCTNTTGPCNVAMNQARAVTATFSANDQPLTLTKSGTGTGTLSVTASAQATNCSGNVCSYPYGTTIKVDEAPGANAVFAGWTGECTGLGTSCQFSMTKARSLDAAFAPVKKRLQLASNGGGTGTVTVVPTGTPCTGITRCWDYDYNTQVTVYATPDTSSTFTAWSPNCSSNTMPCTFNMTADVPQTATFVANYRLSVTINGDGTGSVNGDAIMCSSNGTTQSGLCSQDYPNVTPSTVVTLMASPSAGTLFSGWSGGTCSGTGNCVVTMNQARSVTATFTKYFTLQASVQGPTPGTVAASPTSGTLLATCGGNCWRFTSGATVVLTASPATNTYFANWNGDCGTQGNPCTVTMSADRNVTAIFGNESQLTVNVVGDGTVNVGGNLCTDSCSSWYLPTDMVTLTASTGYLAEFAGWSGGCTGMSTTCTVTMDATKTVTARFYTHLEIGISGSGAYTVASAQPYITCAPYPGYTECRAYPKSSPITLTASPSLGWGFTYWANSTGCAALNGSCSFNLDAPLMTTAMFMFGTYFKASNVGSNDQLGSSIAISGDGLTLAVGAPYEASAATGINGLQSDNSKPGAGAVYVYALVNNTWVQQAYVKASNSDYNDHFGSHVALSADGSTLVVSASEEDSAATGINGTQSSNASADSGAVYVFTRAGTTWSQQAYIKASQNLTGRGFGTSLALAGDGATLAVGAGDNSNATGINGNQLDASANGSGAVYVFTRSGSTWTQQAYVKASNTNAYDGFGSSVALSGDGSTLAVGALGEASNAKGINGNQLDNSAANAGAVYVFTRMTSTWAQNAYLKASNTDAGDQFAWALAVSSDASTIAVTARCEASATTSQLDNSQPCGGAAYVFARSGPSWVQQGYLKAGYSTSYFGNSVAISGDGSTVLVGNQYDSFAVTGIDPQQDMSQRQWSGAVFAFGRNPTTLAWSRRHYIKAPYVQQNYYFGASVAITSDGARWAIGEPGESSGANGFDGNESDYTSPTAGAAFVFY